MPAWIAAYGPQARRPRASMPMACPRSASRPSANSSLINASRLARLGRRIRLRHGGSPGLFRRRSRHRGDALVPPWSALSPTLSRNMAAIRHRPAKSHELHREAPRHDYSSMARATIPIWTSSRRTLSELCVLRTRRHIARSELKPPATQFTFDSGDEKTSSPAMAASLPLSPAPELRFTGRTCRPPHRAVHACRLHRWLLARARSARKRTLRQKSRRLKNAATA